MAAFLKFGYEYLFCSKFNVNLLLSLFINRYLDAMVRISYCHRSWPCAFVNLFYLFLFWYWNLVSIQREISFWLHLEKAMKMKKVHKKMYEKLRNQKNCLWRVPSRITQSKWIPKQRTKKSAKEKLKWLVEYVNFLFQKEF